MRSDFGDKSSNLSLENGNTEARSGRDLLKVPQPIGGRGDSG